MSIKEAAEAKERGLLGDAWQYVHLAETSYDVRITCELRPARAKGVWEAHWVARTEHANGGWVVVCSYTASYPTAQVGSMAGAVLRGSVEIDRLIDAWALGLEEAVKAAP